LRIFHVAVPNGPKVSSIRSPSKTYQLVLEQSFELLRATSNEIREDHRLKRGQVQFNQPETIKPLTLPVAYNTTKNEDTNGISLCAYAHAFASETSCALRTNEQTNNLIKLHPRDGRQAMTNQQRGLLDACITLPL
jgi:hypothetical protein